MKWLIDRAVDFLLKPLGLDFGGAMAGSAGRASEITDRLYLGGRPTVKSISGLKKAGITHVVSCLDEQERASVQFLRSSFGHLFLGLRDGMEEDLAAAIPEFFEFVESSAPPGSQGKLLVHCEAPRGGGGAIARW